MALLNNTTIPLELADEVIHEILCRLPTKNVVAISFLCKQWEVILSSLLSLYFNEEDGKYEHNDLEKHYKFINVLNRSLSICQNVIAIARETSGIRGKFSKDETLDQLKGANVCFSDVTNMDSFQRAKLKFEEELMKEAEVYGGFSYSIVRPTALWQRHIGNQL